MRNFVSPIIEVKKVDRTNYEHIARWCNGVWTIEGNTFVMYFGTYRTESGDNTHNNRIDIDLSQKVPVWDTYIAKMENGGFLFFESISLESALQEVS